MNSNNCRSAVSIALMSLCASAAVVQAGSPSVPMLPAAAAAPSAPSALGTAIANESGKLSWYGRKLAGRKTASGEPYDPEALTMAHKTLPFGTRVKISNTKNNKSVEVRVNDRGPTRGDRIGDVSLAAARKLGMLKSGLIVADLTVVGAAHAKKQ